MLCCSCITFYIQAFFFSLFCFQAFSAFFYVHSFLQQVTGITASSPSELQDVTKKVCSMSFTQVITFSIHALLIQNICFWQHVKIFIVFFQMMLLAPEQKSRLHYYCAASVFLNSLMLRGYGFNDTTFPHISFQKKVIIISFQLKTKHVNAPLQMDGS